MKQIEEFHQQGQLSIDNIDMIKEMDLSNADVGLQVAKDGRIWLCVNGIALIRFTPHHKVDNVLINHDSTRMMVVGNPERASTMKEVLLVSLRESGTDLCIVECPEEIWKPAVEMILQAHPISLPENPPMFNEKPPRRGGQKRNKWKNVKKLQ